MIRARLWIVLLPALMHAQFVPASGWCGSVHCNSQLNDATGQASPTGLNGMCQDTTAQGSNSGGGVTANGSVVAVTYALHNGYTGPATVVYDTSVSNGGACHQIWSSNILNDTAWAVAPLVGSHTAPIPDEVIAADQSKLWRSMARGTRSGIHVGTVERRRIVVTVQRPVAIPTWSRWNRS